MSGSSQDLPICEDQLANGDKASNENGNGQIMIKTCPEVIENSFAFCWICHFMAQPIISCAQVL